MKRLKRFLRLRFFALGLFCGLVVLGFSGCQTVSFYRQAICGQYQILAHQTAITKLIADPSTPPKLKGKFEQVLKIREFAARELKLPTDKQYLKYVDLHRPYVVWNVSAAPELSLEPKTWWFPIVGRASYRGYFSEKGAHDYAATLEKKGYDVYVGEVETYSTLGWFRDPLLNTFIDESEADLADIIFHELGHQKLFIPGDTDFNEAFATSVAEEGLRRWFMAQGKPERFEKFRKHIEHKNQFVKLVMSTREKLSAVYENPALTEAVKRQRKAEILQQMRSEYETMKKSWGGSNGYDEWFSKTVNNAKLNTVAAYYELVPTFLAVLKKEGGDIEKFFQTVRQLSKLPKDERVAALKRAT